MSEIRFVPFMSMRRPAMVLSIALVLASIFSLATKGLNFGLDFTGGTLIEVLYDEPADLEGIRASLAEGGFDGFQVVNFGSDEDVLVRMPTDESGDLGDRVAETLKSASSTGLEVKRIEYVGPQVGAELRDQGGIGMLIALACVMLYVALQFQIKFSVGAVVALMHDVLITLGVFSFWQLDFDLTVLAALLAVIGYSLNDTIVVSDRIRENFRKIRRSTPTEVIDKSLNQTLGRTLMTSATTLVVLLSLFIFGGDIIHGFSIALILGVVIGTYSSIFIAASLLLTLNVTQQDLIIPEKENADVDLMP